MLEDAWEKKIIYSRTCVQRSTSGLRWLNTSWPLNKGFTVRGYRKKTTWNGILRQSRTLNVKILAQKYVPFASLGYGALFDITLDKNNQIIVINEIVIEERIRDLVFKNNKIFIYQETTGIIGIIDLKT